MVKLEFLETAKKKISRFKKLGDTQRDIQESLTNLSPTSFLKL